MGIDEVQYASIEPEIRSINLLHHLDKYRWAEEYATENIEDYEKMVISTFQQAASV